MTHPSLGRGMFAEGSGPVGGASEVGMEVSLVEVSVVEVSKPSQGCMKLCWFTWSHKGGASPPSTKAVVTQGLPYVVAGQPAFKCHICKED